MGEAIITRRGGGIIISGQTEITTTFGGTISRNDAVYINNIYAQSTATKLADSATLPPRIGNGVSFSTDGTYMSVAHWGAPYVTIYKRSGDVFTKLADPATLPPNTGNGVSFSTDGTYMSVVNDYTAPYVTIYKGSGDVGQKAYKSNNLLDEVSGIVGYGYAKENGTSGETKQVIKLWGSN